MKKILALLLLSGFLCSAQPATRDVSLSWTASTSAGVTGYTISTSPSASGTFTQIGCTGTVPGSTCVPGSTAATSSYQDVQNIGITVFYQIKAVAPACTPTTPVTQACGVSVPAVLSTTIPQRPGISAVVVVVP